MVRLLFALLLFVLLSPAHAADPAKVLRIASPDIDTLDPQNFSDDPSFQIIQALFERILGGARLWREFDERPLHDEAEVQRQVDYIHADPVRHGLVRSPRKWPFSSLHAYIEHGLRPLYWSGDVEARYGARRN